MVIIITGVLNLFVITTTEDLKDEKRFKNYLKISFFIGLLGIVMLLTDWNYLCGYQCLVFTFSPFITLLICKVVMMLSKKITRKEGFDITKKPQIFGRYKTELADGIYQKNNGELKHEKYYSWYTGFITVTPITFSFSLLILIKAWTC